MQRPTEVNYNEEQTQYLVNEYVNDPTKATVDRLAQEMEKSPKSIIGKLSREGVYRRSVYKTKTGESPVTKEQFVRDIEDALGINHESLTGLEKSPKNILKQLRDSLLLNWGLNGVRQTTTPKVQVRKIVGKM